ncbi:MAG: RNA 2',3'-cyclic phosphodiesterase [Eubacteriaceae bacterium]|jgi:2'-5' RNA ligase
MRLFTAIRFPEQTIGQLEQIIETGRKCFPEGRFVLASNLHLTLVFIGETQEKENAETALKEAAQEYRQTAGEPFTIRFTGPGTFKGRGGSILWMGIEPDPALFRFQRILNRKYLENGFKVENRPFKPHITLARKVHVDKQKIELFKNQIGIPDAFTADRASLVLSHRRNDILVYDDLMEVCVTG